jgi:hypothetical protein
MDHQLQTLVRELRNQSCPPEVMERVIRRIARDHQKSRDSARIWKWALAFTVLLVVLGTWQWGQSGLRAQRRAAELAAKVHADRARVAQQTAGALGYIGQVLLQTAAHTQNSISKKAVPPLRDGLQTTRNKIIDRI